MDLEPTADLAFLEASLGLFLPQNYTTSDEGIAAIFVERYLRHRRQAKVPEGPSNGVATRAPHPSLVNIEGLCGVGKTTALKHLGRLFGVAGDYATTEQLLDSEKFRLEDVPAFPSLPLDVHHRLRAMATLVQPLSANDGSFYQNDMHLREQMKLYEGHLFNIVTYGVDVDLEIVDSFLLRKFYENQAELAWPFQLSRQQETFTKMFAQKLRTQDSRAMGFRDRGLMGNYAFASLQYSEGNIGWEQIRLYEEITDELQKQLEPYAIVFLKDTAENCAARLEQRARETAESIPNKTYLEKLEGAQFAFDYKDVCDVTPSYAIMDWPRIEEGNKETQTPALLRDLLFCACDILDRRRPCTKREAGVRVTSDV